tara:strand:+ start:637 stop:1989 length:1353 start_codon:yes stop_codon:yes gene_type:complete
MKSYPLHTCHFFNIFIHQEYIEPNKGANLKLFNCSKDEYALLESPVTQTGMTPGFRVCLQTIAGYYYFLEIDARLIEGKDAFVYVESGDGSMRLVDRNENRFTLCEREYYGITFQAVSSRTIVGLLFFCSDIKNCLRIGTFRVAPFIDTDNFIDENVGQWKCIGGQNGFPSGCTGCTPDNCPPLSSLFGGPPGPTGPQGSTGAIGTAGGTGPQGPVGETGPIGPDGPIGPEGAQGLQGVQGSIGVQGLPGGPGPEGAQGATGPQGLIGAPGLQGPQGFQGAQGAIGFQGETGDDGPLGPTGPQGSQGATGVDGPIGPPGNDPTTNSFVVTWNRVTDPVSPQLDYQVFNDVVTLTIPGIRFDGDPGGSSIITSTSPIPTEIIPANEQVLILIRDTNLSATNVCRVNITSTGAIQISKDLEDSTPFLINETVWIPRNPPSTSDRQPLTYSLA